MQNHLKSLDTVCLYSYFYFRCLHILDSALFSLGIKNYFSVQRIHEIHGKEEQSHSE